MDTTSTSTSTSTSSYGFHFLLVHGAAHGAWCWYRIRCLLECTGHKVTCPDLRGSGIDPTDPATISTFEEYNEPLDNILSGLPEGDKVILVGHSAGGISLTSAINTYPHKILVAVYAGALMSKFGFQKIVKDMIPDRSEYGDTEKSYGNSNKNDSSATLTSQEGQEETYYQLSPLEDRTLAAMLIRPIPSHALRSAEFPYEKDMDKVPRVYIRTLHDRYFSQEQQDLMVENWPPNDVYEIDSDHFLMFSNPFEFLGLLLKVAGKFGENNR